MIDHKNKSILNRKLESKIAVVTGGSAGIGFGTANRFAGHGARVSITGRLQSTTSIQ